jgi:hypothetical protein
LPAAAHAVVAAALHAAVWIGEGALVPGGPLGPAAVHRVRDDGAAEDVLLPVGDARVLVGSGDALLLVPVPAAVGVHGVQALLLSQKPGENGFLNGIS